MFVFSLLNGSVCLVCLTVFVNCLVKQFAQCLGVVVILLFNVMKYVCNVNYWFYHSPSETIIVNELFYYSPSEAESL